MLVLTLLKNEFVLKILNSTPFRLNFLEYFWYNNHLISIWAHLTGFNATVQNYLCLGFTNFCIHPKDTFCTLGRKYLRLARRPKGFQFQILIKTRYSDMSQLTFEQKKNIIVCRVYLFTLLEFIIMNKRSDSGYIDVLGD